jgi:hypothetical protein
MLGRLNAVLGVVALLVAGLGSPVSAQNLDELDSARRIARAGAVDLALARISQGQPRDPSAASWADWELLRLELLSRRGRDSEVLKRVAEVRKLALPERTAAQIWLLAARAAQRLGQSTQARGYYARFFLGADTAANKYRDARFAVIDSYLADRRADDTYRSMLRFQQDFVPLRRDEPERFVSTLIALGRIQEAASWLTKLDKASPSATIVRLRAGLITAGAAIAQARSLLAKGAGEPALKLLLEAAAVEKNRAIEIEVYETRLNAAASGDSNSTAEQAASLWNHYNEVGPQTANQARLLVGDDGAWIERAGRMITAQPQLARSLLGHVAMNAHASEVRSRAQLQIITSLRAAKLPLTAWRLFADPQRFPLARLDSQVRFQLGSIAAEVKHPVDAVRYWQDLAPPSGLSAQEWKVRYLTVLFQAGMTDAGLEAARSLIALKPGLSPELRARLITLASDELGVGRVKSAEALFTMLLPLAVGGERITVLQGIGKAREFAGSFRSAADAFLDAAALSPSPDSDREALRALESGAINLAKAGLLEDARAIYQWLAASAKDPAVRDSATQALNHR